MASTTGPAITGIHLPADNASVRRGQASKLVALSVMLLALLGCDRQPDSLKNAVPKRDFDPAVVERGRVLFAQHCASCHGDHAQGAPNWHRPDASGKWPPPPLNGTGHAWHHPRAALVRTIRQGTAATGGNMPAWGGRLPNDDIDAILAWIQQQWPEELYAAWWRMDRQSATGGR
jgi:mono/diheme cytochrome c family protein